MPIENRSTFKPEDVTLLLTDITGKIEPKPTEEREKLIQSGVHYSEMLPLESRPSERYLTEYYRALDNFSFETAAAVRQVSGKIYAKKGDDVVLVSLARAGTPAGILIKRCLKRLFNIAPPHYTISIVRGRGVDMTAMRYIMERHPAENMQFVDGWTGKGAILEELIVASVGFSSEQDRRDLLAVLADPANITDMCGTHSDFPIASSFLNSTVCGLMSRTVIYPGLKDGEFHGVSFYDEFRNEDRTYEFIDRIEKKISGLGDIGANNRQAVVEATVSARPIGLEALARIDTIGLEALARTDTTGLNALADVDMAETSGITEVH